MTTYRYRPVTTEEARAVLDKAGLVPVSGIMFLFDEICVQIAPMTYRGRALKDEAASVRKKLAKVGATMRLYSAASRVVWFRIDDER